uniref:Tat protein n=1 Tax=Echinostoma caproni TaxID=27848 RepID=A0A183A0Y1_9TREM
LKPLEIKDPRERGQTTSTGSGQTTDPKGKAPQESWTSTPATEVTSQET